jgi:hypothetical protein
MDNSIEPFNNNPNISPNRIDKTLKKNETADDLDANKVMMFMFKKFINESVSKVDPQNAPTV